MRARRLALLWSIALVAACNSSPGSGGDDDDDTGGDDDDDGAPVDAAPEDEADAFVPPEGAYTLEWGPLLVPFGQEDTRCVIKKLGNPEPLKVHVIHNVLGDASHHFIVYRIANQAERTTPFACDPFIDTLNPANGSPIAITQKFEERIELPEGVAFELPANATIRLELHYVNATDGDKMVRATTTFIPIEESEFQHAADFLFMGDMDISIPANSAGTLGPSFLDLPDTFTGANFFAITGHEHQWGTGVTVEAVSGEGTTGTMVYAPEPFLWDEPETVYHAPPFQVPDGGGFNITCKWFNGSDQTVGFGEEANQEMCFFWAYYYPSQGAKVCFKGGFVPEALGTICCPDHVACSLVP